MVDGKTTRRILKDTVVIKSSIDSNILLILICWSALILRNYIIPFVWIYTVVNCLIDKGTYSFYYTCSKCSIHIYVTNRDLPQLDTFFLKKWLINWNMFIGSKLDETYIFFECFLTHVLSDQKPKKLMIFMYSRNDVTQ